MTVYGSYEEEIHEIAPFIDKGVACARKLIQTVRATKPKFWLKHTPFQIICYDLERDHGAIEDSEKN